MTKRTLTQALAKECFDYDPETGMLRWKVRPQSHFTTEGAWKKFNAKFPGDEVGALIKSNNYRMTTVFGITDCVHRYIWLLVYGKMPKEIDHINGIRTDNRITNLRAVDRKTNNKNMAMPSSNSSGHIGVSWDMNRNKWAAYIQVGKLIHLGRFVEKAQAIAARKAAESKYGFHPNHGRTQ